MRRFFHRFGSCRRSCRLLGGGIIGRQAKTIPGQAARGIGRKVAGGAGEHADRILLLEECNQRTWYLRLDLSFVPEVQIFADGGLSGFFTVRTLRTPLCQNFEHDATSSML